MAYTAIETRNAVPHTSMLSKQFKIQRRHRSNTTRWMHESDEIIPTRKPDRMSTKDLLSLLGIELASIILLFMLWWNFCG